MSRRRFLPLVVLLACGEPQVSPPPSGAAIGGDGVRMPGPTMGSSRASSSKPIEAPSPVTETGAGGEGGQGPAGPVDPGPLLENPGVPIWFQELAHPFVPDRRGPIGRLETGVTGGVGLVDLDGDGDLDVLFTSQHEDLRAYRNEGAFRFTEDTAAFGLAGIHSTNAVALGDCDGDGQPELLLSRADAPLLHRREGTRWVLHAESGLPAEVVHGTSAAFLDLDGDGDLDLVQGAWTPVDARGRVGTLPRLFENDGACRFRARTSAFHPGMTLDVAAFDADRDGDPDLLVSNDYGMFAGETRWYENGAGQFRAPAKPRGIEDEFYGMGVGVGDLDHDGWIDAYVTNIARNPFYRNLGGGRFEEISKRLGIGHGWYVDEGDMPRPMPFHDPQSDDPDERKDAAFVARWADDRPASDHAYAATGWSALIADLDADGWNDLFLTNGNVGSVNVPEGRWQRPAIYRGERGRFQEVSRDAGVDAPGVTVGAALGDLDGDGLQDLVIYDHRSGGNLAPRHRLLRNASRAGNFLRIELAGPPGNRAGIGARVEVTVGRRTLVQERRLASGIFSASADALFFGIGTATDADVVVHWPWSDRRSEVPRAQAGGTLVVEY